MFGAKIERITSKSHKWKKSEFKAGESKTVTREEETNFHFAYVQYCFSLSNYVRNDKNEGPTVSLFNTFFNVISFHVIAVYVAF